MFDVSKLLSLQGKTAIVTGAATGIGRTVAELLAEAGARVAGGDVNTEALQTLSQAAYTGRLDVSDAASVRSFFEDVEKKLGGVDVLVNVAGIYPFAAFETLAVETWDRVMAVNARGVFLTCQHALPAMQRCGGGSIVNISSVSAVLTTVHDNVHYNASKAAVNAITRSLALEFGPRNIRSNAVMPGGIATDHGAQVIGTVTGPILQPGRIPLTGGPGRTADIANTVLFLASDASAYINGQVIAVDGGFTVS